MYVCIYYIRVVCYKYDHIIIFHFKLGNIHIELAYWNIDIYYKYIHTYQNINVHIYHIGESVCLSIGLSKTGP